MAAILDINTGQLMMGGLTRQSTSSFTDAENAYTTWATELGLSTTADLGGLPQGDDVSAEIDLGFVVSQTGDSSLVTITSEGGIGFYHNNPSGPVGNTNSTITANPQVVNSQNISRSYRTRNNPPSFYLFSRIPSADYQMPTAENNRWQRTSDTAIIIMTFRLLSGTAGQSRVALRISQGSVEVVIQHFADGGDGIRIQLFAFNTSIPVAGNAFVADVTDYSFSDIVSGPASVVSHYVSDILTPLSGNVVDATSQPAARDIRVYLRSSGSLVSQITSDSVTGNYSTVVPAGIYTVVCLDEDGGTLNALIQDRVSVT